MTKQDKSLQGLPDSDQRDLPAHLSEPDRDILVMEASYRISIFL